MKKLLLILLCLPMIGFGQDVKNPIWVGFVSLNSINNMQQDFYSENIQKSSSASPSKMGLNIQYDISSLLSLNLKLIKSIKRIEYDWTNIESRDVNSSVIGYINIDERNIHDYISLPIVARFSAGSTINFFGDAGFYTAYLLKSTQELDYADLYINSGYPQGGKETHDISLDNINRVDFGGVIGGGLSYDIWALRISLEYGYHIGLVDFSKDSQYSAYNRSHTFMYGLTYNLNYIKE